MADSKFKLDEIYNSDLVQCNICVADIDNPKALPCLHTFCFKCLSSWSESLAKKNPAKYTDAISCPNCREDFPLPKGGVKELKTNFFVNKLKERNELQRKLHEDAKIPCTSCDNSTNQAVGRCVECNDSLCKKCVDVHKSLRILKHHHVLTLEELRTGTLTMHNPPEQEMCPKHNGEVLRFYCETCDEPMCRDCTVLDHPRPRHRQIDLKSAAGERNGKLKELFIQVELIPKAIDIAMAEDDRTLKELKAREMIASDLYKTTAKKAYSEFKQKMKQAETEFTLQMKQLVARKSKEIEAHRDGLQIQKSRLCTAMEMTQQITHGGSEHDVATMYSPLSNTMQQLSNLNPKPVRKSMGKVEFIPSMNLSYGMSSLGSLNAYEQWTLVKTIASGQFRSGRYIVLDKNGEIAVATYNSNNYVRHFDENGTPTRQIQTSGAGGQIPTAIRYGGGQNPRKRSYAGGQDPRNCSYPWGLVIAQNGDYFITDENPYVKIFNAQGNFKQKFSALNLNGTRSHDEKSLLYGLAIDLTGRVYVGSSFGYISIHNQNSKRVSGFSLNNLCPYFIAITADDHVIVSDYNKCAVHVYGTDGTQLHTFATPPGGKFYPTGICVIQDEVFVASYIRVPAVYRYSLTGDYIGILTKEVRSPWGMAIKDDGEELLVCDDNSIKVFHP
ncbi:E3 ubiquitin-protein ligase TRIM45-like [Amphiura filiformis]|uniref:E3 ubiquitin-protein ligase TRIM45-like n=1 Tax=Amphiura filiformis TaxID=82378 RepID=UPI003B21405D